jgi:hypothetical protein
LPYGICVQRIWQELYVNTEPASNMAAHSLGIRLENQGFTSPEFKNRTTLEMMYGATGKLMVHGSAYVSDFYQQSQHLEGGSVYAKYRFLSIDTVQSHFRGAVFGKASISSNPFNTQEIALEGDNSGLQGGLSLPNSSISWPYQARQVICGHLIIAGNAPPIMGAKNAVAYSLSAGYLLLPKRYSNYNQVNVNVYAELLGKSNPGYAQSYLDVAPAVQFIFNSVCRLGLLLPYSPF